MQQLGPGSLSRASLVQSTLPETGEQQQVLVSIHLIIRVYIRIWGQHTMLLRPQDRDFTLCCAAAAAYHCCWCCSAQHLLQLDAWLTA